MDAPLCKRAGRFIVAVRSTFPVTLKVFRFETVTFDKADPSLAIRRFYQRGRGVNAVSPIVECDVAVWHSSSWRAGDPVVAAGFWPWTKAKPN
jgi:hypothetical protein